MRTRLVVAVPVCGMVFGALAGVAGGADVAAPLPLPAGAPMYYCAGNDVPFQPVVPPKEKRYSRAQVAQRAARRAAAAKREGLTSLEVYVKWWLCEPERGRWDFSYYDVWERAVEDAGMRWVPLLIAGPAYGTPPWFIASPESVPARCLEHDKDTKIQSIWNRSLRVHVAEFVGRFAAHFDARLIESVKLGMSGDYGESLYPAGGNHWTYLDERYHVHWGYWCGDPFARADFRRTLQQEYEDIGRLNAAWATTYPNFEAVEPFLPSAAPNRRARLDLQRWYCASMTEWVDFWLRTTRQVLPRRRIQVSTGGEGASILGADFSAQAEVAARCGAGLRITNEATNYAANFMLTRQVASACRHYGAYFGIEPAGAVKAEGIVGRIYNATASGADELFTYDPEPSGERARRYAACRSFLVKREPMVDVGLFLNRTSWDLGVLGGFSQSGRRLRAVTDFDVVDERLIADGALERLRALFWVAGAVVEPETARALEAWVRDGGILALYGIDEIETVEGDTSPQRMLLPGSVLNREDIAQPHFFDIGSAAGDRVLRGKWHGAESGLSLPPPDTTFRWSTEGSEMELPLPPSDVFTVAVCLVGAGPQPNQQVLQVDGREVCRVPGRGRRVLGFQYSPPPGEGERSLRLAFGGPAWRADPPDTRMLGVAVVWVAVCEGKLPQSALHEALPFGFVSRLSLERIAGEFTRRLGRGAVVYLPPGDVTFETFAKALVYQPGRFVPGARAPYRAPGGDTAGVYVTRLRGGGALLLNFRDREARVTCGGRSVVLAPRSITEVARGWSG